MYFNTYDNSKALIQNVIKSNVVTEYFLESSARLDERFFTCLTACFHIFHVIFTALTFQAV